MKWELTKYFSFSSSFEQDGKVIGHNYRLGLTLDRLTAEAENLFVSKIQTHLISKIHSQDLRLHTPWFEGRRIDEESLLLKFSEIISQHCPEISLRRLSLERDSKTAVTLQL